MRLLELQSLEMGLGYSNAAQKRQEDLHEQKMRPVRPVKKAHFYPAAKARETTTPIFIKPGSEPPKTLNGDVKMPETKDDDSDEDVDYITQSLPAIREEAKVVLEKFLKRSLSQNDASSPMRQVLHEPQLEVITEDKTVVSENGTHHSPSLGAKPKKKFVQSKNGALKVRPSFDRSDSYMAAAKQSVLDAIQKRGERGADGEWKPQARNKANTISSADYKDNAKRSSGVKYPRRASSQKADDMTPAPLSATFTAMSTITTTTVDRKDSWSSRHDSSSDDDADSFKKRKKKNVFTRAKERLRMSFRKRELNAREKYLRKESKRESPKHRPVPKGGDAPVINIHKATPSPDKSSSGSLPVSSPSTADILDSITLPTPSSRGSYDKASSNGSNFDFKQSGSRDYSEGHHTPTTPSPSGSKKFSVKTGSQTPTTPSPSSSKKFKVKTGSDSSRHSIKGVEKENDESKQSLWKWFKNSKLGVKRRSSKEKGSRTPTKSVEITSSLTVSDTRINQVNRNGSTDIVRTSSLGRYEGLRIQQNLSSESRTSSVGAHDSHRFKRSVDIIVAHGPSGESGRDAPKRKESIREELKRTFSISKGDNIGIQKKHSFKGRCSYADRDSLTLDLVPCRPRPSGGEGLSSVVVADCTPGTPDESRVLTPSQKPHSDRSEAEKDEIYDKIAEKLANIAEDYPSTPFRPKATSPPQHRATVAVDHAPTPPGAAGGHDGAALEKELAKYLRKKGDNMDLVDGTAIPHEALVEIVRTMSYRKFKKVMRQYTQNNEPDFHQMAQLFHLARGAVQLVGVGGNAVNTIKDYTLNYFVDYFAGWIIGKGGWDSVIEDSDDDDGTQV